ncbi:LOW QUALITY PROTEIN: E3 ubiquitin/ISG15 ligase TRIM25-like [Lethenteron reissneri]|uniref:LOW QUALITY PROTEIN: E3 ubiquitin/ISG15 ligase TRIM25-like n=1 Tax=Lethenteron reissneri TaxID=7753 RepID=UPI002AB67F43|nr:LOW QUALITY PROTEIN: E3 ubiquitin/ISG15 ligase TRIM25-like [Lethenteron reissneri]
MKSRVTASVTPSESVDSELHCSLCLGTFVCPSTLSCGHSFCLRCLEATWETASSFSCPQCQATFPVPPQLRRNVALANLAEQLRVGDGMAATVMCDNCPDGQTPAVRTCLRCEMSYCARHLRPHLENRRLRDHVMVAPITNLEDRWCRKHSMELKLYCTVDSSLVCSTCKFAGEHKEHKVLTLKKEHETRKTRVGEETRAVEEKRKEAEETVKRMESARNEAQKSVAGIRGRITGRFARLRKALDEDEREALRRVAVKERELLSRIEEDIARHKREIGELLAAAARLRALQHERDSLAFLQGHLEETRSGYPRREIPKESAPPPPTSLDVTTMRSLERAMRRLLPLIYGRSPTLDTNSAHDILQISSDLRTVTWSGVPQRRPHHPRRFDVYHQALFSESYSSGQHYWEVEVGSARWFRVGAAYWTIPRRGRGDECLLGESDVSWCLLKLGDSFSVRHGGVVTSLSVPEPTRRVGVHLDWDAGLLSFYSADSMVLLHSFHQTFTQPLYPGLLVGWGDDDNSVRIVDLSGAS